MPYRPLLGDWRLELSEVWTWLLSQPATCLLKGRRLKTLSFPVEERLELLGHMAGRAGSLQLFVACLRDDE